MLTSAPKQTRFTLPLADDVRLVTVESARAVLGITAESVKELYEDGQLTAFNLSARRDPSRNEVRIWAASLRGEPTLAPEAIIADCLLTTAVRLPENFHLNNSQLERAWCVSNQILLQLIAKKYLEGVRVGRNWKVNRSSAAKFLKERML
jgi:hypothetical protein